MRLLMLTSLVMVLVLVLVTITIKLNKNFNNINNIITSYAVAGDITNIVIFISAQ